jgi:hypothetical protein
VPGVYGRHELATFPSPAANPVVEAFHCWLIDGLQMKATALELMPYIIAPGYTSDHTRQSTIDHSDLEERRRVGIMADLVKMLMVEENVTR